MRFRAFTQRRGKKGDQQPELHRTADLKTPQGKEWHSHECLGCSYDVEAPQTLFPGRRGVEPPVVQLGGRRAHSSGLQDSTSNSRHLYLCSFTPPASSLYTPPSFFLTSSFSASPIVYLSSHLFPQEIKKKECDSPRDVSRRLMSAHTHTHTGVGAVEGWTLNYSC